MPNTFTQIFVQVVFGVKGRECVVAESFREELERYMSGIITQRNCKVLAIYCNPDHTHVLIGLHPGVSVADVMRDVKAGSSKFINDRRLVRGKFYWQDGYGAFSYSKSQVESVVNYILNQHEHHRRRSFREEYVEFLEKFGVEYDYRFVFEEEGK